MFPPTKATRRRVGRGIFNCAKKIGNQLQFLYIFGNSIAKLIRFRTMQRTHSESTTENKRSQNGYGTRYSKGNEIVGEGWYRNATPKRFEIIGKVHSAEEQKVEGENCDGDDSANTKIKFTDAKEGEYCFRCGKNDHRANKCPHQNSICSYCSGKGHLQSVYFKAKKDKKQTNIDDDDNTANSLKKMFNIHSDNIIIHKDDSSIRSKFCIQ